MTTEETTKILLKLHNAYPNQDKFLNSQDFNARISIWDVYFKDFPFSMVEQAVNEWIATMKTYPQISELLPRVKDIKALAQSPKNIDNIKPTWEVIYEARHGELKDEDIPPEISAMTDEFVKWLRSDPKMREKWRKEQEAKKRHTLGDESNFLPYEI